MKLLFPINAVSTKNCLFFAYNLKQKLKRVRNEKITYKKPIFNQKKPCKMYTMHYVFPENELHIYLK